MHVCKYCNKEFTTGQKLGGHVTKCDKNPNKQVIIRDKHPKIIYNINCVVCNKPFDVLCTNNNFIKGKYRKTCSTACARQLTVINTDLVIRNKNISASCKNSPVKRIPHNKRDRFCEYCGNKIDETIRGKSKYCSDICNTINKHNKLSKLAKEHNFGGYNEKQFCMKTKSIRGWYKNIFCGSSWELAFVMYCLDHNLPIQRCTKCLTYIDDEGVTRKYYPDFEIDGVIYEIKGYKDKFALIKEQCFPEIVVIDKPKIQQYIFYATNKYGKDYVQLLTNKCRCSSIG